MNDIPDSHAHEQESPGSTGRDNLTEGFPPGSYPAMVTPFHEDGSIDFEGVDRLTDYTIETGAAGIFACGLSAEIDFLTDQEKVALARRIIDRTAGRVAIVGGAITSGPLDQQAALIRQIHDAGADAVTISVCQLADHEEDEQRWLGRAEALLERLPQDIRLAMYECPWPYHRLIADESLGWAAQTGRFYFLKDTSCNIDTIRRRLQILGGSRLQLFNAHTATLLQSLQAGAFGHCGIGTNYMPELYGWLCANFRQAGNLAAHLQDHLTGCVDLTEGAFYPTTAKEYLRQRGYDIGLAGRRIKASLPAEIKQRLAAMRSSETEWLERVSGPDVA
jgi:4-hydroxy-tetrahydrodipicolinate synthase